jgi:hypothetical protein
MTVMTHCLIFDSILVLTFPVQSSMVRSLMLESLWEELSTSELIRISKSILWNVKLVAGADAGGCGILSTIAFGMQNSSHLISYYHRVFTS